MVCSVAQTQRPHGGWPAASSSGSPCRKVGGSRRLSHPIDGLRRNPSVSSETGEVGVSVTDSFEDADPPEVVRQLKLSVVAGPARGLRWEGSTDRCSIGSSEKNEFRVL